jgi:hypothetical protein
VLSARQLDGLQQILLGIEDVTERQERAQATLQESEERFRNMADAAPVMIWTSGPDRAFTFFNKGWLAEPCRRNWATAGPRACMRLIWTDAWIPTHLRFMCAAAS